MARARELALIDERARLAQDLAHVTERLSAVKHRLDQARRVKGEAIQWFRKTCAEHSLPFSPANVALRNFGGCYEAAFRTDESSGTYLRVDDRVYARLRDGSVRVCEVVDKPL